MKEPSSKTRGKRNNHDVSGAAAFHVLAELGSTFEDQSCLPEREWLDAYTGVAAPLMETLALEEIKSLPKYRRDKCIVVRVESRGFPRNKSLPPGDEIRHSIKALVERALADGRSGGSSGPILPTGDDRDGQLFATVLLLDDLDAAKAFCKKTGVGEVILRDREQKPRTDERAVQDAVSRLIESLPEDYSARCEALSRVNDEFRGQLAQALEPRLNQEAQRRPHGTYEEKKDLAKWVNAELRRFGLALKNPRSGGKPCLLMGNPGGKPGFGRFLLEYTDDHGKRHHPLTSVALPHLELVPDDLTRASYTERARRNR